MMSVCSARQEDLKETSTEDRMRLTGLEFRGVQSQVVQKLIGALSTKSRFKAQGTRLDDSVPLLRPTQQAKGDTGLFLRDHWLRLCGEGRAPWVGVTRWGKGVKSRERGASF